MIVYRYKMLLEAVPFPLEVAIVASTLEAAIAKAKRQNRTLHIGKLIDHEVLAHIEI